MTRIAFADPGTLAQAVATGDCATAVNQMPAEPTEAQRVAVARCALVLNRPDDALAWLQGAGTGPLAGYADWIRAQALADVGRQPEALALASTIVLPGQSGQSVQLLLARIRSALGDPGAQMALNALVGTPLEHEARFWAAEGLGGAGDPKGQVAELETLWSSAAPEGWDIRAAERLRDLGHPVPALSTEDGRALALVRVSHLKKAQRHAEALTLLLAVYEAHPESADVEPRNLARAHSSARQHTDALPYWQQALGPPDRCSGGPKSLFDYALTHARTGDYDTASIIYSRLITQHPTSSQAEFATYKLGYMEYDRGRCEPAVSLLQAHMARYPNSKRMDEALWFISRCQWRDGAFEASAETLSQLRASRPASSLASGAAYWQARALGMKGDPDAEQAALKRVIASWPTSGYAWFAATRIGRSFPSKTRADAPPWPPELASQDPILKAEALLSAGLNDLAREELARVDPGTRREAKLALAWALVRAGNYRAGRALAKPYCVSPWKDGDPVAQQACTPMPEAAVILKTAQQHELDPLLPFGIMTAESALRPEVTSVAGARGLMQLMPELAEQLHADLYPTRAFNDDDLYSAPYNATLGTTELGRLKNALGDVLTHRSLPAVIASYNGGEEAVRRWLSASPEAPEFDAFAEDISYTETRRYVKRVLGFVMTYRWVYGDPVPPTP
jgi:soluble lytic murein transglycosylase-like protein